MVYIALNCVGLTHSSVIQIIYRNISLKCCLFIYLNFWYCEFLLTFIFYKVV